MDVDAQRVIDELASEIGRLHVVIAVLRAQVAQLTRVVDGEEGER